MATIRQITLKSGKITYEIQVKAKEKGSGKQIFRTMRWQPDESMSAKKAEKEAIILDPCYTGKAFAGLMEMVKSGKIAQGENVIFVHTGGSPGISTPFHRVEIEAEREKYMHIL